MYFTSYTILNHFIVNVFLSTCMQFYTNISEKFCPNWKVFVAINFMAPYNIWTEQHTTKRLVPNNSLMSLNLWHEKKWNPIDSNVSFTMILIINYLDLVRNNIWCIYFNAKLVFTLLQHKNVSQVHQFFSSFMAMIEIRYIT